MKKTKLTYVRPTFKVVELHVKNRLLVGSENEGLAKPKDYEQADNPF